MTKARDLANGGFGLVLVKPSTVVNGTDNGKGTVSFSAVSSVSLNSCFNSTFSNYKIVVDYTASSGHTPFFRLRNAGTTESGSYYYMNEITTQSGSTTITNTSRDPITNIVFGEGNVSGNYLEMNLFNPFIAARKGFLVSKIGSSATESYMGLSNGVIDRTTSYDGIHFEVNSGNMTGSISVYGYNK